MVAVTAYGINSICAIQAEPLLQERGYEMIARKSAEVLQKIKADSRPSHYIPPDRVLGVFMGTDDKRD